MRQTSLFSRAEIAEMRDPTRSRNYSASREEFRREHERRRFWGLRRRHAEKLHRLREQASGFAAGQDQTVPVAPASSPSAVASRQVPVGQVPVQAVAALEPAGVRPSVTPPPKAASVLVRAAAEVRRGAPPTSSGAKGAVQGPGLRRRSAAELAPAPAGLALAPAGLALAPAGLALAPAGLALAPTGVAPAPGELPVARVGLPEVPAKVLAGTSVRPAMLSVVLVGLVGLVGRVRCLAGAVCRLGGGACCRGGGGPVHGIPAASVAAGRWRRDPAVSAVLRNWPCRDRFRAGSSEGWRQSSHEPDGHRRMVVTEAAPGDFESARVFRVF